MADRFDRDLKQAELYVKRSYQKIADRYEALYKSYANHEKAADIAGEYVKWLAQLLCVIDLDNREERKAVMARLEEILACDGKGEANAAEDRPGDSVSAESISGVFEPGASASRAPAPELLQSGASASESHKAGAAEPAAFASPAPAPAQAFADPPVIEIKLNDGSDYPIHIPDVKRWQELYPAVDIITQLRKMAG